MKNPVPFLAVRGPVHEILGRCRRPFVVYIAVSRLSISCSFRRYWPSKFPLSCKVVENRSTVFWTPIFCGVDCGGPKNIKGSLLPWFTPYRVAKFD